MPHTAPAQWREQLQYLKILTTTLMAVLPQGHPLADKPQLYIDDLSGEDYIQLGNNPHRHISLTKPILYVNRSVMAIDLVRRHMGVSIISSAASQNLQTPGVVFKEIADSQEFDISLVYLKSREESQELRMLLDLFRRITP